MSIVSQSSLAVLALTNRLVDAGVAPLKAPEIYRLLEVVDKPSRLMGLDESAVSEITAGTGIDSKRLVRLLDTGIGLAVRLDALYERGITPLTVLDGEYPTRLRDRLGSSAPPVLYSAGDVALLGCDGIGMVGSHDLGPEGVEATRKVAHQVAHAGLALISGGAKGVDKISMSAAYEAGGTAVGVLADSLERAIGVRENRSAILEGRSCLCTPYRPDARFTVGTAAGRNKIIYGLSRVTLVVASAHREGGTWSGATEALQQNYGRVAVWGGTGGGPGNAALVASGGIHIDQPEQIFDLAAIEAGTAASTSQMSLGFVASERTNRAPASRAGGLEQTDDQDVAKPAEALGEPSYGASSPLVGPAEAVTAKPTGICWCGCGQATDHSAFFLPRHAPGAAQRAAIKHFGSVEQFLATLGEVPPSG